MSATARKPRALCAHRPAAVEGELPEMVDVAFGLESEDRLPAGFEWPLYRAVSQLAPWIADCVQAGIHPLRGVHAPDGGLLVARRAKLVVRMPRDRVCAASVLEGAVLELDGARIRVGDGTFRKLQPAATVYSPRVAFGATDEAAFGACVGEALRALGVDRPFICGKRVDVAFERGAEPAFSLAVHDLTDAQSLLLQRAGLGVGQAVGCGLFVPHKTIQAAP